VRDVWTLDALEKTKVEFSGFPLTATFI
jgi:hypothetical protein